MCTPGFLFLGKMNVFLRKLLQDSLGTRNGLGSPGINRDRHSHSAGKGFEGCFNDVVGVDAIQLTDMKGHLGVIDHRHKKLTD